MKSEVRSQKSEVMGVKSKVKSNGSRKIGGVTIKKTTPGQTQFKLKVKIQNSKVGR